MVNICLYFHVHQPHRVRDYHVFDINENNAYFDESKNGDIMRRVARKCYIPTNQVLLDLIEAYPDQFHVTFSVTGTAMEQMEEHAPEALRSFKDLADTGNVEFVAETYYHSLSYLDSKEEFNEQVKQHSEALKKHFGAEPKTFRNTELIFNNELADHVESLGYENILAEGADHVLNGESPNQIYKTAYSDDINVFLRNYELSDDIAFRFSNKGWEHHPLQADTFASWLNSVNGSGEIINLFMDYETFGEHQWESTGIFQFLENMVHEALKHPDNAFATISQASEAHPQRGEIDAHHYTSWADANRDLGAWLGNKLQQQAHEELYNLEPYVKASNDEELIRDWKKLTASDNVYYMYTAGMSDGDVHEHFSPYESPYEAYMFFMNALNDIARRIGETSDPITETPSKLLQHIPKKERIQQ